MALEEFSRVLAELRRKLFYIAVVFGAGTLLSFQYMGKVINKIKSDMYFSLDLPTKLNASKQLADISHNLSILSNEMVVNNATIAHELGQISGELLNISKSSNIEPFVYLTPLEPIMLELKLSLIFGALIASPLVVYYAYKGSRGRLPNMIRVSKISVISTTLIIIVLFLLGAGFSYSIMLPAFLQYIYEDAFNVGVNATFSIYEFIVFVVTTTVIVGLSFELPVFLFILVRLGITSRRTLAYYRRHAYIILLIVAAWVTPDPTFITQLMITVPFVVLYEASLLVMKVTGK